MAKKKKKKTLTVAPRGFGSKNLDSELRKAESRIVHECWGEAYQILTGLAQDYPKEKRIWAYLTEVCLELDNIQGYQRACEHWLELEPNNSDVLYALGSSYMVNHHPLLALRAFRRALACQPDHEYSEEAKKTIPALETFAEEIKANFEPAPDDWWDLAILHEQAQAYLEEGEYAKARDAELQVLERRPEFLPSRNNLSLNYWVEGDAARAIATAKSILETDPGNIHALANLVRFLAQLGDNVAAQSYADRLKTIDDPDAWNPWTKKVEALSYLGDDAGVVEIYEQWQASDPDNEIIDALFHHLVAVALARLDQPKAARAQWKIALELSPGMTIAEQNLNELMLPVSHQHGAWPFSFTDWLPPQAVKDFQEVLGSLTRTQKSGKLQKTLQTFFDQHPKFMKQIPRILERGGPEGQPFMVALAEVCQDSEFVATIQDFALGQNGTDQLRNQAIMSLHKAGLLGQKNIRMWLTGEWQEIKLLGYELYDEPDEGKHSKKVTAWLAEATHLLHEYSKEAALEAEELLQKALAVEPDAPDLLHNLAAAYLLMDRKQEGEALIRDVHQRFPDYLFGCTSLARFEIRDRNFEAAEALLQPLLDHNRFHYSEFRALMGSQVELAMAKKDRKAAKMWLQMWAKFDPESPQLEYWTERLDIFPEL
ncbi:tetratricopeptide tpr-2 repeat protein [Leptolyngbya sp. Heron Island J]|uniref:tetratricopeptide repeat protein n=1 Tax=Leptolyngbya sp. Heron Island J TaxID=1385935 RepID=UPI0003B9D2D8|nr:tetratricopeptide repeat protein [Leptolyngbya sp. Heron Island J]ESA38398.1 tetratricopeptide tpr-2 repeat protein [Leptolyngbya sp. Heron Island J]